MLHGLSWGTYLTGIGVLLALYYAGVLLTCYHNEIKSILSTRKKSSEEVSETSVSAQAVDESQEISENILEEINSILHSAGKEAKKDELLKQIRPIMVSQAGLLLPAYKVAVLNHIIKSAEQQCGVRISEDELER